MDKLQLRGLVLAALLATAACTSSRHAAKPAPTTTPTGIPDAASAAPPLDICGSTAGLSGAGFFLQDASTHDVAVTGMSPGDLVVLQFSHDCNAKVDYRVVPSGAATVDTELPNHANPVAVALHPVASKFVVDFQRPSGPGKVTIDLTGPPTTLPR